MESRINSLAAKIGQYAQRTDSLAENMQRFAQDSPSELGAVEVKPLLETALHLSRIGKLPNSPIRIAGGELLPACARGFQSIAPRLSSDHLPMPWMLCRKWVAATFISLFAPVTPQVCIQFADNGPGISSPGARLWSLFSLPNLSAREQGSALVRVTASFASTTAIFPVAIASKAAPTSPFSCQLSLAHLLRPRTLTSCSGRRTMSLQPRQKFLIGVACVIFALHLIVAATVKPSFG